jgi:hypothetical protein
MSENHKPERTLIPRAIEVFRTMCRYRKSTITRRGSRYPSVDAFDADRFQGAERATLQNVLIRQYRFPAEVRRGDFVAEYWSHVLPGEKWNDALELIRERTPLSGTFLVDDATDASFLAMCQKIVGRDFKASGGIAVRFTGPTGRPVIRLTVVGIYGNARTLYNDNDGPHVLPIGVRSPQHRPIAGLPGAWDHVTEPPKRTETDAWAAGVLATA